MVDIKFMVFCSKIIILFLFIQIQTTYADDAHYQGRTNYYAPYSEQALQVDGEANEKIWRSARWQTLDNRWLGPEYSKEDFQGR